MKHRSILLLVACAAILALAGCSRQVSPAYEFTGGTVTSYQFHIAQHHSFKDPQAPGKENSLRFGGIMDLTSKARGSAASSGLTGTFRNLKIEMDQNTSKVSTAGAGITFLMDTRGTIRDFTLQGTIPMQQQLFFNSIQQTLQEVFPVMPAGGIKPGHTWSQEFMASHDAPPMGTMYTRTKASYTLKKIRKVGSANIMDIAVSYSYRLGDKNGGEIKTLTPGGGDIAMYGDGDGDGTIWFDLKAKRMDSADITTRITSHISVLRKDAQKEMQQTATSRVVFRAGERPALKPPAMPES